MIMFTVKIPFGCPDCNAKFNMLWDPTRAKHEFKRVPDSTFGEKVRLIGVYKGLKGYDKLPSWDRLHRGRAMKIAGKILKFFSMLDKGDEVAAECLVGIHDRAKREGWNWTLDTVVKMAPDWLIAKQGKKR